MLSAPSQFFLIQFLEAPDEYPPPTKNIQLLPFTMLIKQFSSELGPACANSELTATALPQYLILISFERVVELAPISNGTQLFHLLILLQYLYGQLFPFCVQVHLSGSQLGVEELVN